MDITLFVKRMMEVEFFIWGCDDPGQGRGVMSGPEKSTVTPNFSVCLRDFTMI